MHTTARLASWLSFTLLAMSASVVGCSSNAPDTSDEKGSSGATAPAADATDPSEPAPSAPGTPPTPVHPSAKHRVSISYRGLKSDPYTNNHMIYVRVRSGSGAGAADFAGNVQSALITNGASWLTFEGVPEGKLQFDGFIDVDKSASCTPTDESFSFATEQAIVADFDDSVPLVTSRGCEISGPSFP